MQYYPVYLDINDRKCVVVGGGAVGARKVSTLLACGARVTVISPEATAELNGLAEQGRIALIRRPYQSSDLDGAFMVIGSTDDEAINHRIHADAEARNLLCNIADQPRVCNFILPSIIQRGDLVIAVSTSGRSPAFAKKLRKELERQFGDEYAVFLMLLGAIRTKLLAEDHAPEAHKPLFEALIDTDLLEMIRARRTDEVNRILKEILGTGFTLESLIGNISQPTD